MNVYPIFWWTKRFQNSPAGKTIGDLALNPVFKKAKFSVYSASLSPKKLLIICGQAHTVWSGDINNRQRNQISQCQLELFLMYRFFLQEYQVTEFGGEGITEGKQKTVVDQFSQRFFDDWAFAKKTRSSLATVLLKDLKQLFQDLSREWQKALKKSPQSEQVKNLAATLSGYSLLQYYGKKNVTLYAIEGQSAYEKVLRGVVQLEKKIRSIENGYDFIVIKQSGGKARNPQEAALIKVYNSLVKSYNKLLKSDIRERALLQLMKQKIEKQSLLVITIGVAHRYHLMRLSKYYLEKDTAVLFITPSSLVYRVWIVLLLLVFLATVLFVFILL